MTTMNTKTAITKSADALAAFRKASQAVQAEIEENRQAIEDALQRRERLRDAPMNRAEFADALCEVVDLIAARFVRRMRVDGFIGQALQSELWRPDGVEYFAEHNSIIQEIFAAMTGRTDGHNADLFAYFHADRIKALLRKLVDGMEWLDEEAGPPVAERRRLVAALDSEIEALQARETELIADAQAAGLKIEDPAIRIR